MLEVVLVHPEIPANTGNLVRLAANTGARLHLVRPLGFRLTDRALARAGLDYADRAMLVVHEDWKACADALDGRRCLAFTSRGTVLHSAVRYRGDDVLVFGSETRGLPEPLLEAFPPHHRLRLPMAPSNRSLNLANAVAVAVFEAWRQLGFPGGS